MVEFVYYNTKNANRNYTPFELNYKNHSKVSFKDLIKICLKSHFANKLTDNLREQIEIYC